MASPFAPLRPALLVAAAYAGAAAGWIAWGDALPGGRWLAVHLFTLGVLSNLVVALTDHFARTLLHAPGRGPQRARLAAWNAGALLLLTGLPSGRTPVFAGGAAVLAGVVTWLYADLRRLRRSSLTGRFAFLVRGYERACGAFLHGALLGGLLGSGVLGGRWYGPARLAHLHVNVLGWGGLTLLATVVFFGPTVMRARIEPGAEAAAARALPVAGWALTVAVGGLLLTGAGGGGGLLARAVAAAGLGGYAAACTAVCLPILKTLGRGRRSAPALHLAAACAWLPAAVLLDAGIVALDHVRLLDAVGVVLLGGVLVQAVLGTLSYVGAALSRRGRAAPVSLGEAWGTTAAVNAGTALIAAAAAAGTGAGPAGSLAARTGWALVAAAALTVLAHLVPALLPTKGITS